MRNKIFITGIILILLSFIFISNVCFGVAYDLSDYQNKDLKNGSWVIFFDVDTQDIYMITTPSVDYPYISSDGSAESFGGNWLCCKKTPLDHGCLCGCIVYKFNKETNIFDHYINSGMNSWEYFNVGKVEFIASGIDIRNHQGAVVFLKTPLPSTGIIGEMTTQEKMEEIMKTAGEQATVEMGQIILRVIMITAGLIVLLIGLRKGLTVLMSGLRT